MTDVNPPTLTDGRLGTYRPIGSRGSPILLTGSHRSGTTWVGRTLECAPGIGYIDEPFRPDHRPGVLGTRFPYWFPYLLESSREPFVRDIRRALEFRYGYAAELRSLRSTRDVGRMVRDASRFAGLRRRSARPLMKDPIALLSAPWLAREFGMDVIVLIRHPAAFASSLKRMGWTHDFSHFVLQPRLVDDLVPEFASEIEAYARHPADIIDQAVLLWNILHSVIASYRAQHPEWIFLRHEDLSSRPCAEFRGLFARLGLEYTPAVQRFIEQSTGPDNPPEANDGVVHQLRRNSVANVRNWRSRLSRDEVATIRARTEAVAGQFYTEADW